MVKFELQPQSFPAAKIGSERYSYEAVKDCYSRSQPNVAIFSAK
jgi:hypothetical protein